MNSGKRSALNFTILAVFSIATAMFLLREADKAVAEIKELSANPVYLGHAKFQVD